MLSFSTPRAHWPDAVPPKLNQGQATDAICQPAVLHFNRENQPDPGASTCRDYLPSSEYTALFNLFYFDAIQDPSPDIVQRRHQSRQTPSFNLAGLSFAFPETDAIVKESNISAVTRTLIQATRRDFDLLQYLVVCTRRIELHS